MEYDGDDSFPFDFKHGIQFRSKLDGNQSKVRLY